MSSSPSPSQTVPAGSLPSGKSLEILPFPYGEISLGPGAGHPSSADVAAGPSSPDDNSEANDPFEQELQAREAGKKEGLAEARIAFEQQLGRERTLLVEALTQFTRDREIYYQKIEAEVVQLALSIARKILHREAQIDRLLLAGIVRVALEKIEGATGVTLRVHPQNVAGWKRYLAAHMDPGNLPTIVEDSSLEPDRCVLQTAMGTADLGVEVQLKEIERGLMDLLAARPGGQT